MKFPSTTLQTALFSTLLFGLVGLAPLGASPQAERAGAASHADGSVGNAPVTAYALSPERDAKARAMSAVRLRLFLLNAAWGLAVLLLFLRFRVAVRLRDFAEKRAGRPVLPTLFFATLLMLSLSLCALPLAIYGHWVQRAFGLSVQGWASWIGDWGKETALVAVLSSVFVALAYSLIRRFPRRWWLLFWALSLPLMLLLFFLNPIVIDPLFHRFEPLAQSRPELSGKMLSMVERAGVAIPESRFFLMHASEKTTALNAYVTGFGKSKRIVLWDTLVEKMDAPQAIFVAAHELGHYVLRHILYGLLLTAIGLFFALLVGSRLAEGMIRRWGGAWGIRNLGDLASLPLLLLLLSLFGAAAGPLSNLFSRHIEHQADQYALELAHGLLPDPAQAGAQAFQKLGEVNLSDPDPHPVRVFLLYSHPPIPERIRFSLTYDPWSGGVAPKYVR